MRWEDFDAEVRAHIYGHFVHTVRAPLAAEIAREFRLPIATIQSAIRSPAYPRRSA